MIALTALAAPRDKDKAMLAGCNDFLAKPINVTTFRDRVNWWLQTPMLAGM